MTDAPLSEGQAIIRQLEAVNRGTPWHGPSRAALLADVRAEVAAWPPGAGAHSVWETVLHMRNWTREVERRARGAPRDPGGSPVGGDWPTVPDTGEAAWREAVASLEAALDSLIATVRALPPERLGAFVGATAAKPEGTGITVASMLRSLAEHDLYHSGQVSLLTRLARHALGEA